MINQTVGFWEEQTLAPAARRSGGRSEDADGARSAQASPPPETGSAMEGKEGCECAALLLGRARVLLAGRFLRGGERRVLDWAGPGPGRELAGWNGDARWHHVGF